MYIVIVFLSNIFMHEFFISNVTILLAEKPILAEDIVILQRNVL